MYDQESINTADTEWYEQEPGQVPKDQTTRNTGPIDGVKNWFNGWNDRRKSQLHIVRTDERGREKERSAIEKMRDKVAEFDEDYKNGGERFLGAFMMLIGYVGPFALVLWVGSDLGKYYAPVMDLWPAYGLAYTLECIIAGCTIAMGRSFAEITSGKPNYGKLALVAIIWLFLNISSALGIYLVMSALPAAHTWIGTVSLVVRVTAIALCDLGCSAILMFRGQSMQKHIESIRKRATAIGELADAQRQIEEADKNAALRDQMMKSTLRIQEDLSQKIGEAVSMVMSSILTKMEKALKDDDQGKNEKGFGRR